jgi:hypothetical protein
MDVERAFGVLQSRFSIVLASGGDQRSGGLMIGDYH